MVRVAVLDDHQGVAASMADWSAFPDVRYLREHIADPDALIEALEPYEVVMAMRERTPFPRSVLSRLPRLRLLVTTGMRNASIDVEAARELAAVAAHGYVTEGGYRVFYGDAVEDITAFIEGAPVRTL